MLAVCMRLFSRRCLRHTQKCGLLDLSSTRAFVLRSIRICRTGSPRRQMRGGRVLRVLQGNVPRCPCFHDTILPCPGAFVNWHLLRHRAKVRGLSQEGPFYGSSSECENAISCPLFMTGCKEMKTGCKHANDRPFGPLGGPGAVFTCSHPCTSPVWRVSRDRAA